MKLTLREMLLLLLIVPLIGFWMADSAADWKRDAAHREAIDHFRWKAEYLEKGIRNLKDTKALRVTDDDIYIETKYGVGVGYLYSKPTRFWDFYSN